MDSHLQQQISRQIVPIESERGSSREPVSQREKEHWQPDSFLGSNNSSFLGLAAVRSQELFWCPSFPSDTDQGSPD